MITLPDFRCSKQSSHGREERMSFIISEVKKEPCFHLEGLVYTKERCTDLAQVDYIINHCLRMMYYGPQTRKDITEQILMELKII